MEPLIRDVATSGGTVRVELRGRGLPVLLLHGLSAHRRTWDAVLPALEARLALCLPDLPGRGESEPRPELPHGLEEELARLREVLWAIDFVPEVVVGHSHGASLGLALAASEPRVRGLVLLNPVHPWTRRPWLLAPLRFRSLRAALAPLLVPVRGLLSRHILRSAYGPDRGPTDADVARYAAPYADLRRARLLLRVLADWRPAAVSSHLPRPPLVGLVLAGGRDRRIGRRGPARLAARLALEFACVPGAGHVLPEEVPERVSAAVLQVARAAGGPRLEPQPRKRRATS